MIVIMKNYISCVFECVVSLFDCDLVVQDWDDNLCVCKCKYFDGLFKEFICKEGFRYELDFKNYNGSLKNVLFFF